MSRHLVFGVGPGEQLRAMSLALPEGYHARLWRRSGLRVAPPGASDVPLLAWGALDLFRGFRGPDYGALLIHHGSDLVHRSSIFPASFAFPFMSAQDLQIGMTHTSWAHRGKRLAPFAIQSIVSQLARPDRRFWYVVDEANLASTRAASAAGLVETGVAHKRKRFGSRLLGVWEFMPGGDA